ncbi:hypothetical protein PR048_027083 [Dryococelus australis]|uniref:Uncharacterized protein n=1 Tax=Dryococelus australis TaxID=614101 RepID=A0ABQ9GEG7_9NEOP|nr:hypothetical protein PR048_027083 [Dryococelus australis]
MKSILCCGGGETRRPAASSGTIPTRENPGATPPGIKPGSPRWEATKTLHHNHGTEGCLDRTRRETKRHVEISTKCTQHKEAKKGREKEKCRLKSKRVKISRIPRLRCRVLDPPTHVSGAAGRCRVAKALDVVGRVNFSSYLTPEDHVTPDATRHDTAVRDPLAQRLTHTP